MASSGTSSYLYAGLDGETSALALELEALGGGDAALGRFEVTAVVNERLVPVEKREAAKVLWVHGKTVGLRNASLPKATPSAEAMSYVNVSGSSSLAAMVERPQESPLDPHGVADWVLDGFNACILAYGGRGDGKTLALFGQDAAPALAAPTGPNSVAPQTDARHSSSITSCVLRRLYEGAGLPSAAGVSTAPPPLQARIRGSLTGDVERRSPGETTIAVSCWVVRGSSVEDLLAPSGPPRSASFRQKPKPLQVGSPDYAAVQCDSLDAALAVIAAARCRAPGCALRPLHAAQPAAEASRGHFFVRVLVHRTHARELRSSSSIAPDGRADLLSHLHIVDLLGHATPELDPQYPRLSEPDRVARREQALQLQALHRTLAAIRTVSVKSSSDKPVGQQPSVTNGRDSVLTAHLAPLLQGNCRTCLLAFLRDGEAHYRGSKATLASVAGLAGLLQPCHRVSAVPVAALGLLPTDAVLAPLVPAVSSGQKRQRSPVPHLASPNSDTDTDTGAEVTASSSRLDDSVIEFDEFDLLDVAAGAVDRSPGRSVASGASSASSGSGAHALRHLNSQFGAVLREQQGGKSAPGPPVSVAAAPVERGIPIGNSTHTYAQYLQEPPAPTVGQGDTAELLGTHSAGLYRCVAGGGVRITEAPAVAAATAGSLEFGDEAEVTMVAQLADDDARVCFAQLRTGGWVALGGGALQHVAGRGSLAPTRYRVVAAQGTFAQDQPAKNAAKIGSSLSHGTSLQATGRQETEAQGLTYVQLSGERGWVPLVSSTGHAVLEPVVAKRDGEPALTVDVAAPASPTRKTASALSPNSPLAPSTQEKVSPFSPVSGSSSLVQQASGHQDEHARMRQKKVAPPTIDPKSHSAHVAHDNVHADALVASRLLLRAKAAKDKIATSPKHVSIAVRDNFEQQLQTIYRVYNPDKLADVPTILEHFRGREQELLCELNNKYSIHHENEGMLAGDSASHSLTAGTRTCRVVHPHGSFLRDIPSVDGATLGHVAAGAALLGTGRVYCPPGEDGATYLELARDSSGVTPMGGWLPIVNVADSRRVVQVPRFDYERMVMLSLGESSGDSDGDSDGSLQAAADVQADTPPLVRVDAVPSSVAEAGEASSGSCGPASPPRSALKTPAVAAASPSQPQRRAAAPVADGLGSAAYLAPDRGLTLSEAGNKALQIARGATRESTEAAAAAVVADRAALPASPGREVTFLDVSTASAASVASSASGANHLSGLSGLSDVATAAEVDMLRRNTASLMESLALERQARLAAQQRATQAEADVEESASALEVLREDTRLEAHRQRAQLKVLAGGKDLAPVFRIYEQQVERTEAECDELRRRNLELEARDMEVLEGVSARPAGHLSASVSAVSATQRSQKAVATLKRLSADNTALQASVSELRKGQRQYALGLRITQDASSKLHAAHDELRDTQAALAESQEQLQRVHATCAALRADSAALEASDAVLREEWGGVQQELSMLRRRVQDVDEERWRQAQMDLLAAPGTGGDVPDLLPTEGGSAAGAVGGRQKGPSYARPTEAWVSSRPEGLLPEAEPQGAAALEAALSELHACLVDQAPALLPLLRRVGNCLHHERAFHLQARADMLNTVYPTGRHTAQAGSDSGLSLMRDSAVKRAIGRRRADDDMVAAAFANIREHDGVYVEEGKQSDGSGGALVVRSGKEGRGNGRQGAAAGATVPVPGVDTTAALAELRRHRKAVRDAHTLRAAR